MCSLLLSHPLTDRSCQMSLRPLKGEFLIARVRKGDVLVNFLSQGCNLKPYAALSAFPCPYSFHFVQVNGPCIQSHAPFHDPSSVPIDSPIFRGSNFLRRSQRTKLLTSPYNYTIVVSLFFSIIRTDPCKCYSSFHFPIVPSDQFTYQLIPLYSGNPKLQTVYTKPNRLS